MRLRCHIHPKFIKEVSAVKYVPPTLASPILLKKAPILVKPIVEYTEFNS